MIKARCSEVDGAPPGWLWIQLARALAVDPEHLPEGLHPLLQEKPIDAAVDAAYGRFVLRRGIAELLRSAAGRGPLAVLIDDLHRADQLTVELLAAVIDEIADIPVLFVCTSRTSWPNAAVPDTLAALVERCTLRVTVPGFALDEAAQVIGRIAGGTTDADTVRALVERTGGNAFYLVESARLLRSEGSLVALARVPDGVRDVLRRRLRLVPESAVHVLRVAAIIGPDVDVEVLQSVLADVGAVDPAATSCPAAVRRTVEDALDAGIRAGLVVEALPGAVRFAHIVVRETLYDDVPSVRRSRWHASVADALAELRPADLAARAHHLSLSGTGAATRAATDVAVAAAEQALAQFAPGRAAEMYEQALAALDRLVPAGGLADQPLLTERVQLLSSLSRAQLGAGAGLAALETRAAALDAAERSGNDRLLIVALTAWGLPTAWTARPYGTVDRSVVALIERALLTPDLTAAEECELCCLLVREVAGSDQLRATAAAAQAEALARKSGEPVLLGLALHARGTALLHDGDLVARLPLAEELCAIGRRPGLALFALVGHEFVVEWAVAHARPAAAIEHLERIDTLTRTYRWRQGEAVIAMHRAALAHITGDLPAAVGHYRTAVELLRAYGGGDTDWVETIALFSVAASAGQVGGLASRLPARPYPPPMVDLIAVVLTAAGRRAEAIDIRRNAPPIPADFFRSLRLTTRALAVLALGSTAEAAEIRDQLLPFAGQLGGAVTGAFAFEPVDLLLGDLAQLLGHPHDARVHYLAAATVADRCGSALWRQAVAERLAESADG